MWSGVDTEYFILKLTGCFSDVSVSDFLSRSICSVLNCCVVLCQSAETEAAEGSERNATQLSWSVSAGQTFYKISCRNQPRKLQSLHVWSQFPKWVWKWEGACWRSFEWRCPETQKKCLEDAWPTAGEHTPWNDGWLFCLYSVDVLIFYDDQMHDQSFFSYRFSMMSETCKLSWTLFCSCDRDRYKQQPAVTEQRTHDAAVQHVTFHWWCLKKWGCLIFLVNAWLLPLRASSSSPPLTCRVGGAKTKGEEARKGIKESKLRNEHWGWRLAEVAHWLAENDG